MYITPHQQCPAGETEYAVRLILRPDSSPVSCSIATNPAPPRGKMRKFLLGYKRGKVVVCPRCHNVAPYDPAMIGEQLHCPKCDHRFYLSRNVKEAWLPPLARCRKCGTLNGKSVKVCPVCGAKNRHLSGCGCLLYALLAFFVLGMIVGVVQAIMEKQ